MSAECILTAVVFYGYVILRNKKIKAPPAGGVKLVLGFVLYSCILESLPYCKLPVIDLRFCLFRGQLFNAWDFVPSLKLVHRP